MSRPPSSHLPQIDALRGVAVLAVLLFHAFPARFPLGYLGVDVFFVVSGFVIGRTYLYPLARRETPWGTFWAKRLRRLAPAYFACVLLTAAAASTVLEPHLLATFGESLIYQPLHLQNVHFWLEGDYFEQALTRPLLHTWSLAVEEQFYLFFFVPVLLARLLPRRAVLLATFALGAAASFALALRVGAISPKTPFYLLPFRVWQFLAGIGAFVAVDLLAARRASARGGPGASSAISLALLLGLTLALLRPAEASGQDWWETLAVSAAATLLLGLWGTAGPPPRRAAPWRPLDLTGRLSYSLYLWHWPLISLASLRLGRELDGPEASLALLGSFAAGWLSWRFVEGPARARAPTRLAAWLRPGLAVSALTLVAGTALVATDGLVSRYPEPQRTWLRTSQERSPYRCPLVGRVLDPSAEFCAVNGADGDRALLVLGDSHADQLDEMIARLGAERGVRVYLTARDCDFDEYGRRGHCPEDVLERVLEQSASLGIDRVLAISSWSQGVFRETLARTMARFEERGVDVAFVLPTPMDLYFDPRARARATLAGDEDAGEGPGGAAFDAARLEHQNADTAAAFAELAERHPGRVSVVDTGREICPGPGPCDWLEGELPLYFDRSHLSRHGVRRVERVYRALFDRLYPRDAEGDGPVSRRGTPASRARA